MEKHVSKAVDGTQIEAERRTYGKEGVMKTKSLVLSLILMASLQGCYTQLLIEEEDAQSAEVPYLDNPSPEPILIREPVLIFFPVPAPVFILTPNNPPSQNDPPHRDSGVQRSGSESSQQSSQNGGRRTEGTRRSE